MLWPLVGLAQAAAARSGGAGWHGPASVTHQYMCGLHVSKIWLGCAMPQVLPPPFPPDLAAQPVPAGTELLLLPKHIPALLQCIVGQE